MATTITKLYDGLSLEYQNGVGGITQRYLIEGLSASNDPADLFGQAIQVQGVPQYRSPHPTIKGLYASAFRAAPWHDTAGKTSRTQVLLEVTFSTPTFLPIGGQRVRVGGSNSQFILNRWPSGNQKGQPIFVGYSPKTGQRFNNQISSLDVKEQTGTSTTSSQFDTVQIPIESPNALIQVTRAELASPLGNVKAYRRKLNQTPWMGFDPYMVLCRQVTAENMVGMGTIAPSYWNVDYYFEVVEDPTQWVHVEFFRDIHTGKPMPGVNLADGSNNGYTLIQPYNLADFNGLKFTPLFV